MGDIVIRVAGLGKKYRIRHRQQHRYTALRDVIAGKFRDILAARPRAGRSESGVEDFWALRGVSFEVRRGEVVGIIGRNGAGKSTLLKIFSQITEPTEGRAELSGRIASLLEVGTGFHPELTGRENIYLNAAVLGMSRAEMRRRFDEIVAFAEVEKFLDTPVKRYSSGMYVRLAFSVAAHLEPEILVIDEVLAVGDAEFQRKCLGRMQQVSKGGRTVLFVSHNMAAVQSLCSTALYLESGRVRGIGNVDEWVNRYLAETHSDAAQRLREPVRVDDSLSVHACEFVPNPVESGGAVRFRIELASREAARMSELALLIYTQQGARVAVLDFRSFGLPTSLTPGKRWELRGEIRTLPLVEGDYSAGLYMSASHFNGNLLDLAPLTVGPRKSTSGLSPYPAIHRGLVDLEFGVESMRQVAA